MLFSHKIGKLENRIQKALRQFEYEPYHCVLLVNLCALTFVTMGLPTKKGYYYLKIKTAPSQTCKTEGVVLIKWLVV